MPEYDAVKYNTPPTEQEIRNLQSQSLFRNPEAGVNELLKQFGYIPSAHENIDTLISNNENKDYFELIDKIMPVAENFVPPIGAIKLLQLMNQPQQTEQAMYRGLKEAILGEPDPVGPQGMPFSQFMQQKKALNPKVKSIVNQHVNDLFKK